MVIAIAKIDGDAGYLQPILQAALERAARTLQRGAGTRARLGGGSVGWRSRTDRVKSLATSEEVVDGNLGRHHRSAQRPRVR